MSNRKNHRRNDKFTGRTRKWHMYKFFPKGMDIIGWDDPSSVKWMKHIRIKRMRMIVDYKF